MDAIPANKVYRWRKYNGKPLLGGIWAVEYREGRCEIRKAKNIDWLRVKRYRFERHDA